ncbi:ATP-binding cassette domain-containing protein [Kineococcus rhizosphaerae]|uniref:Oligopeptide/dipeptide transporter n=1 Tax=Kineococcus rhizosphaerae TaxID=559628 RepID=A0A2T0R1A6_9ACTN|nr:ATP-binding cassette domain-containing protein [Kineococcus rhizosphaerae]PRY13050.1 oligopeptide/dipeptide transporter [Kineococcus rhizosphaerae]
MTGEVGELREPGEPLLRVRDLAVDYGTGRRRTRVVHGVGFDIAPGRTLGLVGESGSGKSTIGGAVLGLVPVAGGSVEFEGRDLATLSRPERRALGARRQVVFQDPYSSLDPTLTIGASLAEPCATLPAAERMTRAQVRDRTAALLQRVGLGPDAALRYPAQFSGGQRQRIAIARALMLSPRLVVCDEPVSALDLSVQAEVLNLLTEVQRDLGLSLLFISHDLSVVRHVAHEVAVLRAGRIVEHGPAQRVHEDPQDPYTRALLAAAPVPDPDEQQRRRELRRALAEQQLAERKD